MRRRRPSSLPLPSVFPAIAAGTIGGLFATDKVERPSDLLFHGRRPMVGCAGRPYRPELVMMKLADAAFHWPSPPQSNWHRHQ
jgi:hypothetical protein